MIIKRSTNDPVGVEPAVLESLLYVSGQPTYHGEYGYRLPVGMYNVSLHQVWRRFPPVLDSLQSVISERPFLDAENHKWHETLISHHESLLYSLMEHIEDCQNILKGFFPKTEEKSRDKAVKKFTKAVKEYRDYVARIVNGIKHNQLRLHSIVHYSDEVVVPGYFVLGPDETGVLGPAPAVHSPGNEAFSFSWDLRYHFAHIYVIAHHLAEAICAIRDCSEVSREDVRSTPNNETILAIASQISELPRWVYMNEVGKPFPQIDVSGIEAEKILTIEYPARRRDFLVLGRARVSCAVLGDGVSTSFRFPSLP